MKRATGTTRNDTIANNLNANVRNPFLLSNFASLQQSNPALYADLSRQGFFTSTTIRKNQLMRAFPQMNGLVNLNEAGGMGKSHSMEISFERRMTKGVQLHFAYTMLKLDEADFFANEYDRDPTWRPSNDGRPHRIVANGIWQLPFGKGRRFATSGPANWLIGGWQLAVTWDY
ncbi:MAG: hypothetical protein ABIZ80_23480, partial [Bryobacteraceae bacterium]